MARCSLSISQRAAVRNSSSTVQQQIRQRHGNLRVSGVGGSAKTCQLATDCARESGLMHHPSVTAVGKQRLDLGGQRPRDWAIETLPRCVPVSERQSSPACMRLAASHASAPRYHHQQSAGLARQELRREVQASGAIPCIKRFNSRMRWALWCRSRWPALWSALGAVPVRVQGGLQRSGCPAPEPVDTDFPAAAVWPHS
jgi:hypothetical protein